MKPILAGAAVLAALLHFGPAHAAPAQSAPAQNETVAQSWDLFKARFLAADGRVVDDANGSVSHSEGQGYGMLVAVAADDRAAFDRMLAWTEAHLLVREDELAAWRWNPAATPAVEDLNNASDGDLLIAWALVRGAKRWNRPELVDHAKAILDALAAETVVASRFGPVLLPGSEGFGKDARPDGPVVNLSYWIFPALAELEGVSPAFPAADLSRSGMALLEATVKRRPGIAPDWTSLHGKRLKPAEGFPAESGYNALRVPLYLAWAGDVDPSLLEPWAEAWLGGGDTLRPRIVDMTTAKPGATAKPDKVLADPGYAAVAGLLACATHRPSPPAPAFEPTNYYPSILHILSQLARVERYPACT